MNVAVSVGFAFAAIIGICLFILWFGSAAHADELEDRIGTLEARYDATYGPADDSPDAMAAAEPDDAPTEEFPAVQPDTAPMPLVVDPTPAVQARRDAAWDERRPSPVPRDTEYVTREVNIGGTLRSFRIPAMREDA